MKRKLLSMISLLLTLCMCGSLLVACKTPEEETSDKQTEESTEVSETKKDTEVTTEDATAVSTESESDSETETETEPAPIVLDGEFGSAITNAYNLKNKVQTYYLNPERTDYRIENMQMGFEYELMAAEKPLVTAFLNSEGKPYLQNTMDVYIKMESGKVYYASETSQDVRVNIYKYGYYYYETHLAGHKFGSGADALPIQFERVLHTYSDKMNQILHFATETTTTGIKEFGMTTLIAADTVEKLIVKDATGRHDKLDGVDWATAEYVGFDIKDAGVFGYILLPHENSGKLSVTLENGNYILTQAAAPKNGTLLAVGSYTENDFYMGQRLYTDSNHDFDAFLKEAEYERHPMTTIGGNNYVGYDALRGAYEYSIGGDGFNEPFFTRWNNHFYSDVKVTGTNEDRAIYMYSRTSSGAAEGAALMNQNKMLIPIPTMVFKNFHGENEEPLFDHGDMSYGITLFPMTVEANTEKSFYILNAMQNWGKFPLKQLSSIQFTSPYYHLSTGVTETSCIAPWYAQGKSLWSLPDFRPMSAKWWFEYEGDLYSNQPQHQHAGYHYFLQYTDADGDYYASENVRNEIVSSGLNYAEAIMDYVSDDDRIAVSYKHIEMPQTDEHRVYYEMTYEVLEDVSFKSLKREFSFLSLACYAGTYKMMGYLNSKNEIVHEDTNRNKYIKLGDKCPYLSLYKLEGVWEKKCGNIGFIILNSDITVGGKKYEGSFGLYCRESKFYLTLDLDKVTLKQGDKMTINIVLTPWGSEESEDDSNMIKLRENTCLNPLSVTVSEGEKLESTFVPKVKTTDGKTAEFTLSGGWNNSVVRIYGFEKLTVPKIYEKIDGEWVEYVSNSTAYPDKNGTTHPYDGYFVYYDGDGTYSYTFLVDMTDAGERTFKIDASEDFKGWETASEK